MAQGPGKYDDLATLVRERSKARGTLVVVVGGNQGSGFSVQTDEPAFLDALPSLLRSIADQIEEDAGRAAS